MDMLDEKQIAEVLDKFYERVRADDLLGPVFAVVADWDEHLQRLGEFWSSVLLISGRYKGNPVSMHSIHAHLIRPEMFARWLELWRMTTDELLPLPVAAAMQAKAARIAARLSAAVLGSRPTGTSSVKEDAVARPYKMTAEFSDSTIPAPLLSTHSLKAGTWGVIRIRLGAVRYLEQDKALAVVLNPENPGVIAPETPHYLELIGPVALKIEFYDRKPANLHS
ncbi:DUF1971 domain-containing protein [Rhizobiaceae bacterium n13]|uniref:DUF1971 domain-containing protein n=1 Tax=Ferirhizobium litorale TaxID=2927786 RepID=A0AAE3U5F0_9HYPH|nr:DUF1971 domain-containing protein [Fererhizobium litorale]MDI7862718.1 DUF1971 domain-containing protein [Fererhizobium litorale]MDI7924418.1 DUF1971 domain-containing protein [Fererhizobium litorale]